MLDLLLQDREDPGRRLAARGPVETVEAPIGTPFLNNIARWVARLMARSIGPLGEISGSQMNCPGLRSDTVTTTDPDPISICCAPAGVAASNNRATQVVSRAKARCRIGRRFRSKRRIAPCAILRNQRLCLRNITHCASPGFVPWQVRRILCIPRGLFFMRRVRATSNIIAFVLVRKRTRPSSPRLRRRARGMRSLQRFIAPE